MWEGVARFVHTAPVPHLTPGLVRHIVLDLLLPPLVALLRAWCVPFLSGGSSRYGRVYSSTRSTRLSARDRARVDEVPTWVRCCTVFGMLFGGLLGTGAPCQVYRSPAGVSRFKGTT